MGFVRRRRIGLPRATAGLLAAALIIGPLLESAHQASVRHIACPEDGELIDAPAQSPHARSHEAFDGARFFAERDPAAPQRSGADHDHCAVALRGHLRARESAAPRLSLPAEAVLLVTEAPVAQPPLRSIALYRLAPKSGPPQA